MNKAIGIIISLATSAALFLPQPWHDLAFYFSAFSVILMSILLFPVLLVLDDLVKKGELQNLGVLSFLVGLFGVASLAMTGHPIIAALSMFSSVIFYHSLYHSRTRNTTPSTHQE